MNDTRVMNRTSESSVEHFMANSDRFFAVGDIAEALATLEPST
jgi:hypothetical protein